MDRLLELIGKIIFEEFPYRYLTDNEFYAFLVGIEAVFLAEERDEDFVSCIIKALEERM